MRKLIGSKEELAGLIQEYGFLPLLKNNIPGFSVEEHTLPAFWFVDGVDGPWEWKGPVIQDIRCAYGKFFDGKAGLISEECFPDFVNCRRGCRDFAEQYEAGFISHDEKRIYDVLTSCRRSTLSKELRYMAGFGKGQRGGFDTAIKRLQMQGYVVTVNFEYQLDRFGRPYGWGMARYALPEQFWGDGFLEPVCGITPEQSSKRVAQRLARVISDANGRILQKIAGQGMRG